MNTEQLKRLSFSPMSTLFIYLRLHSLRKMAVILMAEFSFSECMRKNDKILLLLGALLWLVCSGGRCVQFAGLLVFYQMPGVDLKVMSTVAAQTVPKVTQMLSCARILKGGFFISYTEALFYVFRIYVQRFDRTYSVKKTASR